MSKATAPDRHARRHLRRGPCRARRARPALIIAAFLLAGEAQASPHPSGAAAPTVGLTDLAESLRSLRAAARAAGERVGARDREAERIIDDADRPTSASAPSIEPPGWSPPPIPEGGFPYRPQTRAPAPRVLRYTVAPEDTLADIASRFGTTVDDIRARNRIREGREPRTNQKLELLAERFPLPRLRVRYRTAPGDTWESIARGYGLDVATLKRHNPRSRRLRSLPPKLTLQTWVEASLPRLVEHGPWLPWSFAPTAPTDSLSRGYPHGGRLTDGARLPDSPLYTLRTPDTAYGSTHAMQVVQHAIAAFRHETGYPGEVLVCSLSKKRGGRFPPHKSHRSGRDVDIGLVAFPGFPQGEGTKARGGKVDWAATWLLMRHFLETEQVTYIFLSYHLQPALHEAAQALGATDEELERWIQWPRPRGKTSALIRHARGHTGHFHVRIKCGPDEPRCKGY